jgi:hypothetical protein
MVRVAVGSSRTLIILIHGTDPDRGEACVLDVVEVFPDSIPSSATPLGNEKQLNGDRKMDYQVWSWVLQAVRSAPAGSA